MKSAFSFPNIAGITIKIHWTFSLIILWIIYINFKAGQDAMQISWSVLFVLSLFVCVTLHEFGHALAAKRYGIKTKDITLYPIGGVARLEKMPEKPLHELVVAFAGPAVNVIIMLLLLPFILGYHFDNAATENALVVGPDNFLPMVGLINIWLALFNLIPAFPMDGGRVLRALLAMKSDRVRATQMAATVGKLIAIGFIIAGFYFNPFLIFIGLFVILGAQAEAEMVKTQFFITDLKVADALMINYRTLDAKQPIADAVKMLLDGDAKNFIVTTEGIPVGVAGRDEIIKGIKEIGEAEPIEKITNKAMATINIDAPLGDAFSIFQNSRTPVILVTSGDQIKGIIDAENIAELIMVKGARKIPQ